MSRRLNSPIIIVGGGVIGLAVAYHLAKMDAEDVLLIERNQLTSGTSWHAAGIVGPLRPSLNMTKLARYALELLPRLEAETGQATGYRRTGGYWLARGADKMTELRRMADFAAVMGMEVALHTAAEIGARFPLVSTEGLAGGLWVADDGQANPVDISMAYAKAARAGGVRIREGVSLVGVETRKGAVHAARLSSGETLSCAVLVNCAGAWAAQVGTLAGVPVPLQAVEHMYVVTEPMADLPDPVPILRDLEGGIYIKGDAGRLVLGGFEYDAKPWDPAGPDGDRPFLELPEDWEQFEPFMMAGLARVPALAETGIQHFMVGPESFTPDSRQLLGESPFLKGFFVAAGMNSTGMMSSPGIGKALAEWILEGAAPMDLWEIDIARMDQLAAGKDYLHARMEEAVGDLYAVHWPFKQPKAGRDLRRLLLHDELAAAGAVFGAPAGWERPLWFAESAAEREQRYSFGDQCWWPAAAREAEAVRDRAALFELSPFAKFDIAGPQARDLLQQLAANDMDVASGRAVYTQMLNDKGGIEADVTVTRKGETAYRVVSGAATRWRDFAWMTRQRDQLGLNAEIHDVTAGEVVLGIMGPRARDLLAPLTSADLSATAFPFATSQVLDLGPARLRATRISFAGELGWELYIPVKRALEVYRVLTEAGAAPAGLYALESCRLEKSYRHWGHDIGPDDTPLEAGLSFAVAWDKPSGFIGREALLRQREAGLTRRLVTFAVTEGQPLLLHDEPIYRNGDLVGRTTSGGRGFRSGLSLCMGYIDGTSLEGDFEIAVAGARFGLKPLKRPAYDPMGRRLRG